MGSTREKQSSFGTLISLDAGVNQRKEKIFAVSIQKLLQATYSNPLRPLYDNLCDFDDRTATCESLVFASRALIYHLSASAGQIPHAMTRCKTAKKATVSLER
jgi:hypothetical protein